MFWQCQNLDISVEIDARSFLIVFYLLSKNFIWIIYLVTFLTLCPCAYVCVSGGKNVRFLENFTNILNEWSLIKFFLFNSLYWNKKSINNSDTTFIF